jgi:tetratricopeptide (TPR) repeat protein
MRPSRGTGNCFRSEASEAMNARCAIFLGMLVIASDLSAQTAERRTRPRTSSSAASSAAVRAELAAVLLESGKYADAAREYRWLLQRNSRNTVYRLGLAQALAWGGSYRDAEEQLLILGSQRPGDDAVEKLKQLVRPNLEPSSGEARRWVFERPHYPPYRMALARALVRERHPRAAIEQYDMLLASNPTPTVVRGLAAAYNAANDRPTGIARLRWFVARAPADTGFRLALADLLLADRQYAAAIAETDTVLSYGRTADVLLARARIDIARDDLPAAERDLNEALALKPTPEAYLLLGDTHRWRGQFGRARTAYEYARTMKRDRTVTAAFAQLARDQRGVLAFEPEPVAEDGWQTSATADGDNAGIHYSTLEFRRGFDLAADFVASVSMEARQLRESRGLTQGALGGYAFNLGLAREAIGGAFYGKLGASAGFVTHPLATTVPTVSLALTGRYYAWSASFDVSTGPAYPTLRTIASVIPDGRGSSPLTAVTSAISLAGPVGSADIAVGMRQADISDQNNRTELQAYARLPLTTALSAIYWGNTIGFTRPTASYWSPTSYASNALGFELAARQLRGWSVVARALPGFALTDDSPFTPNPSGDTSARKTRFLITTGAELAYRRPGWESAIGLGWGHIASYSRTEASIRITLPR